LKYKVNTPIFIYYDVILKLCTAIEISFFGRISETTYRRSTKLMSKCTEGSISYPIPHLKNVTAYLLQKKVIPRKTKICPLITSDRNCIVPFFSQKIASTPTKNRIYCLKIE